MPVRPLTIIWGGTCEATAVDALVHVYTRSIPSRPILLRPPPRPPLPHTPPQNRMLPPYPFVSLCFSSSIINVYYPCFTNRLFHLLSLFFGQFSFFCFFFLFFLCKILLSLTHTRYLSIRLSVLVFRTLFLYTLYLLQPLCGVCYCTVRVGLKRQKK